MSNSAKLSALKGLNISACFDICHRCFWAFDSQINAAIGYTLAFYKAPTTSPTMPSSYGIFWIDKTRYEDKSATLASFYQQNPLTP